MRAVTQTVPRVLLLASIWHACQASRGEELADLIEKAEKFVVRINVETADSSAVGSGFVIADETIVTNFHVVEGARSAEAEFADESKFKIEGFLAADPPRDVAILKVRTDGRALARLAAELPRKGDRVVAIGAPKGLSFSSSDGIVSAVRTNPELEKLMGITHGHPDMTWVQTTAAISGGNSGGPLLNMAGDVVGMNTMTRLEGQNLNFAVSARDIQAVLDRRRDSRPFSRLPRGKAGGAKRVPTKPGEPPSLVYTLPSGRVLDIDAIFLAVFKNKEVILRGFGGERNRPLTFHHPNGEIAGIIMEERGVLHGQVLAAYETGEVSTFATYLQGQLHGNLLTWDPQGRKLLFAQYAKGKEHGLLCLFKEGELWFVREAKGGKPEMSHLFADGTLVKSFAASETASDELNEALERLEDIQNQIKKREVEVKRSVMDVEKKRRKAAAAANSVQSREASADRAALRDAISNDTMQRLYRRAMGGP